MAGRMTNNEYSLNMIMYFSLHNPFKLLSSVQSTFRAARETKKTIFLL